MALLLRINQSIPTKLIKFSRLYATALQYDEEHTATPQYPPILDLSYEKRQERKKAAVHEEIQNVETVEEKQIKLNMPKYYGFKCYIFREHDVPYNSLNLSQHITRTHLVDKSELPAFYDDIDVDTLVQCIIPDVEELILMEYNGYHRRACGHLTTKEKDDIISTSLSHQMNRLLLNTMSQTHSHLLDVQVDYDPRIESFWFAGGMNPPENIKKYRKCEEWRKGSENEPTDRAIQYFGAPSIALRSNLPLKPIIPYSEAENGDFEVPFFQYDPRVVGTTTEHRHATNTPGFWPGESNQLGTLSFHRRGNLLERNYKDKQEDQEALHRQAILSSFAWLSAQANFLGFTTFNDITYPLVTQSVITNGQFWSFYAYQLNTMLLHSKNTKENPKRNLCWATPELKLFDSVTDNRIEGLNTGVLKMLLKFYANAPQERIGLNMRPYLKEEQTVVAEYEDAEKRSWLEREYKFMVSNRPRYKLEYELYHWEKIYKVDNATRVMEPRRRPFELFVKPSDRKLNERQAFYVPKKLRPDLPKHKGRYAKEYFP